MTNDQENNDEVTLRLPASTIKKLERLAAKAGRTPDDQATYLLKVMLGIRSADHDDKAGRQIATLFQRMLKNKPIRG